jgi:hypothetical protein
LIFRQASELGVRGGRKSGSGLVTGGGVGDPLMRGSQQQVVFNPARW